jgi:hypothetical protein
LLQGHDVFGGCPEKRVAGKGAEMCEHRTGSLVCRPEVAKDTKEQQASIQAVQFA